MAGKRGEDWDHLSTDDKVCRAVWRHGRTTRRRIVEATGLSQSTVARALARLIEAGRVWKARPRARPTTPGQPPATYAPVPLPEREQIIGFDDIPF